MAELGAQRKELRSGVNEDVLTHYDRVLKHRGSALAAVGENQMCSACQVIQRPQVFQEVMSNQQIVFCSSCSRIMYYVPPPPKPEEEKKKSAKAASPDEAPEIAPPEEPAEAGEAAAH